MLKKGKTKGESVFELVHEWTKLDSPESIEEAVRRWTGKKNSEKKPINEKSPEAVT